MSLPRRVPGTLRCLGGPELIQQEKKTRNNRRCNGECGPWRAVGGRQWTERYRPSGKLGGAVERWLNGAGRRTLDDR